LDSAPVVVWTDPIDDQRSLPPGTAGGQTDLIRASLATRGDVLVVRVYVRDMSLMLPAGSQVEWSLAWNGGEADAMATGRQLAFWDMQGNDSERSDTGRIVPGPGGSVEIDVPFAHLQLHHGETLANVRGAAAGSGPIDASTLDTAGSGTYTIPTPTCS
jgi:hypothetical protein